MRSRAGFVAMLIGGLLVYRCSTDGGITYQPPIVPIEFTLHADGRITAAADIEGIVTPFGTFGLSYDVPLSDDPDTVRVIFRDRNGPDGGQQYVVDIRPARAQDRPVPTDSTRPVAPLRIVGGTTAGPRAFPVGDRVVVDITDVDPGIICRLVSEGDPSLEDVPLVEGGDEITLDVPLGPAPASEPTRGAAPVVQEPVAQPSEYVVAPAEPSATAAPSATPIPPPATETLLRVDAAAGWVGWEPLQRGDVVQIDYDSGSWTIDRRDPAIGWTFATGYTMSGFGGAAWDAIAACRVDPTLPPGYLIAGVTDAFRVAVGAGLRLVAPLDGPLALRINDQDACLGDNAGDVTVRIARVGSDPSAVEAPDVVATLPPPVQTEVPALPDTSNPDGDGSDTADGTTTTP